MRFYRESDAPALDLGVQRRLRRLDENLEVTWSIWELHPMTSWPLETDEGARIRIREPDGKPSGRWYLWSRTGERWYYVRQYKDFGHAQVLELERDPARTMSPAQIFGMGLDRREREIEKGTDDFHELKSDVRKANKSRIRDALDGNLGRRQARIASYDGQSKRATPGEINMDRDEDGWEIPAPRKRKTA